jgi:hypothetical protein
MNPVVCRACSDELRKIAEGLSAEEFKAKLRPGDVILSSHGVPGAWKLKFPGIKGTVMEQAQTAVNRAIALQLGSLNHAGIYVGSGQIIDAHPAYGVKLRPIDNAFGEGRYLKALRPILPTDVKRSAVNRAKNLVGDVQYSGLEAIRAWAAMHLDKVPVRDRRKKLESAMCAELVQDAYRGQVVPEKHRDVTVPPDFATSKVMRPVAEFGTPPFKPVGILVPKED